MAVILPIFIAVLVVMLGAYLLFDRRMRRSDLDSIKSRLLGNSNSKKKKKKQATHVLIETDTDRNNRIVEAVLRRFQLGARMQSIIEQSGLRWKVATLGRLALIALAAGFLLAWYFLPPPLNRVAFLTGPLFGILPVLYVLRKKKQRIGKFEGQFPEGLEFVARAMRAGHAFSVSLEMLHREFDDPLASEFHRTFDEQNLGLPLDIALEKLAGRMPLLDVQFFVSAVLLQKRTGGNLAEVLEKLALLIRERFKLRGRIRAISAHGRMTGTVLSAIPVAVGGIMFYVNPQYVLFFIHDSTGHLMLGAAIGLQILGYAFIKKIVSIEV